MDSGKNGGRLSKTRYSDTSVPFKYFIDPSEFPLVDNWEKAEVSLFQAPRRSSFHPTTNFQPGNQNLLSTNKNQRQTSLSGITDSSLSSGFASDLSSAAAPSTRFPSFSLASMESLEAADSTWFNFDPNGVSSAAATATTTTTNSVTAESSKMINKKDESNSNGSKKHRRFADARQRSGSMAAGNISTIAQNNQQKNAQRRMSFSVPTLQAWKRNGYFIQLEDDSCTGNEDTRAFVLCQLTGHGASEVSCLACGRLLPVYDHFPLLDGALFLSPICHRGGLQRLTTADRFTTCVCPFKYFKMSSDVENKRPFSERKGHTIATAV
ncbi:unnamed protein product [Rodentolepis nana]|uniref:Headcase domain-containing protein n=1 Tax=Rodentolepis nana TaxID=102285 RepID=A0A0R3TV58_RODNA|nr:unnamed protein product [Rodentolepis nana]